MAGYTHKSWACPFFSWDERLCVHCECGSRVRFYDQQEAGAYQDRYCASVNGWKDCTVAASLLQYYDREDG